MTRSNNFCSSASFLDDEARAQDGRTDGRTDANPKIYETREKESNSSHVGTTAQETGERGRLGGKGERASDLISLITQ